MNKRKSIMTTVTTSLVSFFFFVLMNKVFSKDWTLKSENDVMRG